MVKMVKTKDLQIGDVIVDSGRPLTVCYIGIQTPTTREVWLDEISLENIRFVKDSAGNRVGIMNSIPKRFSFPSDTNHQVQIPKKAQTSRVEYKTTDYEFTHGKKPRGRGFWCFRVKQFNGRITQETFSGLYSEVKKEALRIARVTGAKSVEVLG